MSGIIDIIAIIPPKPDKVARVIELLEHMAKITYDKEPGALRYSIHKEVKPGPDGVEIVMIEHYKDAEAQKVHLESEDFQKFGKALGEEGLLRGEVTLKIVQQVGGFAAR